MNHTPKSSAATSVNFLPDWYLQRRRGQRVLYYQACMLGGIILLFGWLIALELHERSTLQQRHATIRQNIQATRQQARNLPELRKTHQQLVDSLQIKRRLYRPVGYAEITATLVDLVPPSISLRNLRVEMDRQLNRPSRNDTADRSKNETKKDAEGNNPRVVTLRIEGIGPSDTEVSRFTGALASNPLFSDVEIGYWRQDTHDGLHIRRFGVRTTVPLDRRYQPPDQAAEVTDAG